nr:nucleotide exchange factor GrpE [Thioalkalivibrio sp. HK1]
MVEPDDGESQAADSAGSSGIDKIVEGMALTLEMLDGAMGKHGIEIIDPKGELFNPEVHQAISEVPSEGVAPKTVIDVFQKGCLLNGRVIRAAMVVIAK